MSKLYAKITPDDHPVVTRQASSNVEVFAQTEYGRITIGLNANGSFVVYRQPVNDRKGGSPVVVLATGNINEVVTEGATVWQG